MSSGSNLATRITGILEALAGALLPGPGTVHLSGGIVRDLLLQRLWKSPRARGLLAAAFAGSSSTAGRRPPTGSF